MNTRNPFMVVNPNPKLAFVSYRHMLSWRVRGEENIEELLDLIIRGEEEEALYFCDHYGHEL